MKLLTFVLAALTLLSPDGKISVTVESGEQLRYSVSYDGRQILSPSAVSMTLDDGTVWGAGAKPRSTKRGSVDTVVHPFMYEKSEIHENYNWLLLRFRGFDLEFRAYDSGVAYRFVSASRKSLTIKDEQAEFSFASDWDAFVPYVKPDPCEGMTGDLQFMNSFENVYERHPVSAWKPLDDGSAGRLAFLPITVKTDNCLVCITESDLYSYPGMYLGNPDGSTTLKARFAPYPKSYGQGGYHNNVEYVIDAYDYIARADAGRTFPWRVLAIAGEDKDLMENDLVYLLARADDGRDWSWVKSGQAVWEWLVNWNMTNVPFKAGVNTETYKYFIDYAAAHGVPYLLMDEGWFVIGPADMMNVNPDVDMEFLCRYAAEKGVGIVAWAGCYPLGHDMENLFRHYSEMGLAGFKVDFLNRDDQPMLEFYEKVAETAARYHMVIMYHGVFKPVGLSRQYPNVLNYEGDYALENMKWENPVVQPEYDVTMPFARLVAGPVDINTGLMSNSVAWRWRPDYNFPSSQGTRCHQLAAFVSFYAPFAMLSDAPSVYDREKECFDFIRTIPQQWDETRALDGKIGEYTVIARRSGSTWFVSAMTNWNGRKVDINLDFLDKDTRYRITVFRDGPNCDRDARDYLTDSWEFTGPTSFPNYMQDGGGFVARIEKCE